MRKHGNTMKTKVSYKHILCSVLALAGWSTPAYANQPDNDSGIDFQPIQDGGSRFTVRPPAFDVSASTDEHTFTKDRFSLPAAGVWRVQCYVVTPWLPIPARSDLSIFPSLKIKWMGAIDLLSNKDVGILNFVLESRKFGETKSESNYFGVDSGMMDLTPVMFPDENTCVYFGELDSSFESEYPILYQTSVPGETEVRAKFCGLTTGAQLDVTGITLQALPVGD